MAPAPVFDAAGAAVAAAAVVAAAMHDAAVVAAVAMHDAAGFGKKKQGTLKVNMDSGAVPTL